MNPGLRRSAAAALLGAVTTLGFPPYDYHVFSLLGLFGLVVLWERASPREAFVLGLMFGLAHFLTGIYWVFISTHIYGGAPFWMGLLLALLLSSYGALHIAAAGWLATWRRPASLGLWALLQVPAAWVLAELLRDWHPVWSFPWLSLGYAFTDSPLARLAPVLGVHGISGVVVLVAGSALLVWRGTWRMRGVAVVMLAALLLTLFRLPQPGGWTQPRGEPLAIGLVQGNIPQELKWLYSERNRTLQLYRGLSQELLRDHPQTEVIIWPEAAIPALYNEVRGGFLLDMAEWADDNDLTLLTGILHKQPGHLYNTMRAMGKAEGLYIKRHLVPFGEFFPVPDFMRSFLKGINLDYEDLSHGPVDQPLIKVEGVSLGISICFEDVFGRDIRRDLPAAGLLVNVTNDAWFADSSAPYQHLQIARMRAMETGRELIRVSNRGVSGRIGADGTLYEQLPMFKSGSLALSAQPYAGSTPFVRWGYAPLWIVAASFLLVSVLLQRVASRRPD